MCCRCNQTGLCQNCICVKRGSSCQGCLPQQLGTCVNTVNTQLSQVQALNTAPPGLQNSQALSTTLSPPAVTVVTKPPVRGSRSSCGHAARLPNPPMDLAVSELNLLTSHHELLLTLSIYLFIFSCSLCFLEPPYLAAMYLAILFLYACMHHIQMNFLFRKTKKKKKKEKGKAA